MIRYAPAQGKMQIHNFVNASDDEIRQYAPSVFADAPHPTRTNAKTYQFINTGELITSMRQEGWAVTSVGQRFVRDEDRHAYARHFIRLRHADHARLDSDAVPEGIIINAHDATASHRCLGGLFRFVCANGLIAGDIMGSIKAIHSKSRAATAFQLSADLLRALPEQMRVVYRLREARLNYEEMMTFFAHAIAARWPGEVNRVQPKDILETTWLREDQGDSAWQIFNHAQRVLITNGGAVGRTSNGRSYIAPPIRTVDQTIKSNIGIFNAILCVVPKLEPELLQAVAA